MKYLDARACSRRDRQAKGFTKLEDRNTKCRACIDESTHVRRNIWTQEHARGQTDRQTFGLTDRRTQTNALILTANTLTQALMNERMYDQTFGRSYMHADKQTDKQTDGLTHTHSRTRRCTHTNASMLTRIHDALRYIRMDG